MVINLISFASGKCEKFVHREFIYKSKTLPVIMYCESLLKAQSQTHLWDCSFSSVIKEKSAVFHILTVVSAEHVAKSLEDQA